MRVIAPALAAALGAEGQGASAIERSQSLSVSPLSQKYDPTHGPSRGTVLCFAVNGWLYVPLSQMIAAE